LLYLIKDKVLVCRLAILAQFLGLFSAGQWPGMIPVVVEC